MESIAKVFAELLKPELLKIIGISGLVAVIVSLVVYNVFAYIGNFGFAELAARNKIRRDFANATGIQISELANKHYWAIANAAGTLSVGLRDYLEALELSLYVARDLLQVSSSLLAEKASSETFPSFVHLVGALHNFQFIGSNDYLLPDYSAGRHLRRLYNEFRESLLSATPERGDDLATGLLQWRKRDSEAKTDTKDGEDKSDEKKGKSDSKSSADKFDIEAALDAASRRAGLQDDPALADPEMEGHRKVWEEWLCDNLPDVLNAAVSLEAFSRVMQHQIAELHRDWFHDRRRDRRSADELAAARRA
ncbi:MAG TPA: hypothetical protein VGR45_14765, partial [Stellaceae bacterium]|nr:hypothetical protein [Stellaceae bacterium]